LCSEGDRWNARAIEESERNLRTYLFVSTARIIAARGSSGDAVVALVVTKDLWSMRPTMDVEIVGSRLNHLPLAPGEDNLNGRSRFLGAEYETFPLSRSGAASYSDPWFAGRHLSAYARQEISWKKTGAREGYATTVALSKPLYRLDERWSWTVSF